MTAAYKIALAAGATLLLIVIASLILRSEATDPDPAADDGTLALDSSTDTLRDAPAIDPLPPADDPELGLGLDLDPVGPPRRDGLDAAGRPENVSRDGNTSGFNYADEPAVEIPVGSPEPNASMTVGRPAFADDDPFNRRVFDPLDETITPPEPEPITLDLPATSAPTETAESPQPAEANTGIALSPVDPVARPGEVREDAPLPPPAPPVLRLYTIESGDSLSSVALATYGNANKWVDIAQANPFVDPNRLRVGQEIKLPDLDGLGPDPDPATTETVAAGDDLPRSGATYIVKSGDNLSNIAKQFYNSSAKWELIYQANRGKIGNDPGNLQLGMELLIPPPDRGAN